MNKIFSNCVRWVFFLSFQNAHAPPGLTPINEHFGQNNRFLGNSLLFGCQGNGFASTSRDNNISISIENRKTNDSGLDSNAGNDNTDMLGDKEKYLTLVRRKSLSKLREIAFAEIKIKRTELVGCIRYLLNHRNHSNDESIKYHLNPRRLKPGWQGMRTLYIYPLSRRCWQAFWLVLWCIKNYIRYYPKPSILVPLLGQCFKRVRKKTYQDLTIRTIR